MSRSKRFLGGVSLGYANQVLVMLVGLWLSPFLLKHIGQHDYGLWLAGLQTLSYLTLMDFGIVALLPRETAYATGRAISGLEGGDLALVVGKTARVVLYQTPLVAIAVAIFWFTMPSDWHSFRGPITVALAGFTILFPLRIFQAVLQGMQDMLFLGRLQAFAWLFSTGLMVVLVLKGFGLYALGIGWATGQLLPAFLSFYRLRSHFPKVLPSRLSKFSRKELFQSLTSGFWVSAAQIAQVLVGSTDLVVILHYLGPSAVVPYAFTQKLIMVLGNQPNMIMEIAMPGISQMRTSESRSRIFQVSAGLSLGMLTLAGAVACVTLAANHSFVSWWVGDVQFGGVWLTVALASAMLLRHWNTTAVYSIFALGYERRISITTLLDGVVSLAASAVLVHLFGPIGAPLGSIVGVCCISLPGNLWALAHEVGVSPLGVLAPLRPWFLRFVLLAPAAGLLGLWWRGSFLHLASVSFGITVLYCVLMLPMIMHSGLRSYLPERLQRWWENFRPGPVGELAADQ